MDALYHFSAQAISRKAGRSSVKSAAYRAGVKMVDGRTGEVCDYSRKRGVLASRVFLPGGGTMDRAELWNKIEAHHKRGDAVVAREFEISLPRQLNDAQRQALAFEYAAGVAERYGVAADVNLHAPDRVTDKMLQADPDRFYVTENGIRHNANWHMHLQLSACHVDADGNMGKKCVELDPIHMQRINAQRKKDGLEPLQNAVEIERALWAEVCNKHLEMAGLDVRVDHRSFADRGITDREPTTHHGVHARAIERKTGEKSDRRLADEAAMRERAQEAAQQKIEEAQIAAELAAAQHQVEVLELDLAELELDQRIKPRPAPLPQTVLQPERLLRAPARASADIRRDLDRARDRFEEPAAIADRSDAVMKARKRADDAQRKFEDAELEAGKRRNRVDDGRKRLKSTRKKLSAWKAEHPFMRWWHEHVLPVKAAQDMERTIASIEAKMPQAVKSSKEADAQLKAALQEYIQARDGLLVTRQGMIEKLEVLAKPERERIAQLELELSKALEREQPPQAPEPPQAVEQAQPARRVDSERSEPARSYPRPRG